MVGLTMLVALLLLVADVVAIAGQLARHGLAFAAAGLSVLLATLMTWQLATEPSGLGRLGWTSVGVEAGRAGQAAVVVAILLLLLATATQFPNGQTSRRPYAARLSPSLGMIGALGSATIAFTCFVE